MIIGAFIFTFISFGFALNICYAHYAGAAAGGAAASATSYASSGSDPYYGAMTPQYYSQYIHNNGFNQHYPQHGYVGHYSFSAPGAPTRGQYYGNPTVGRPPPHGQYYGISAVGPLPRGQFSRAGRPLPGGEYSHAGGPPLRGQHFQAARPPLHGPYYEMSGAGQPVVGQYYDMSGAGQPAGGQYYEITGAGQPARGQYPQAREPSLRGQNHLAAEHYHETSGSGQRPHEEYPLAVGQQAYYAPESLGPTPQGQYYQPPGPPPHGQYYQPPGPTPQGQHYPPPRDQYHSLADLEPHPLEQNDSFQDGSTHRPGQQSTSLHSPHSTIDTTITRDNSPTTATTTQQSPAEKSLNYPSHPTILRPTPPTEPTHENLIMSTLRLPMEVTYQPKPTQNTRNAIIYPDSPQYVHTAKASPNAALQDQAGSLQIDERRR